ncbi:MAG: glycine cleavage system aminomethyltransferase GcvT [Leadbetterella sp.]
MTDKRIPLHHVHESLGAKIIPFGGFLMPVRYSSDLDEHHAVRKNVGVFDVSHMGEFMVEGGNALDFLQKVTSNDVSSLVNGKVQYSYFPNHEGGIVDDLLVYRLEAQKYMLVVNASNIEKDWQWLQGHKQEGVILTNVSEQLCLFAVQGPNALAAAQKLTDLPLDTLNRYEFLQGIFAGIEDVKVSTTGYTGENGVEIYVPVQYAEEVWSSIFSHNQDMGIKPIGLGARDTLRLEMGFCLYGNDIDDTTSPISAGLGWVTKFTKDFIGKNKIQEDKMSGVAKKLIGIKILERGIPRSHYEVYSSEDVLIGGVTSGTMSPSLELGIGMAYVTTEFAKVDTKVRVKVRDKYLDAEICAFPFLKK